MASAQLLQNSAAANTTSRKLGHLEAGKKRLEEFRKKKAEGKAKKATSTGQLLSPDVNTLDRFSENNDRGIDQIISNADNLLRTDLSTINTASEAVLKPYPSSQDSMLDTDIKSDGSHKGFELTKLVDDYYSQERNKGSLPSDNNYETLPLNGSTDLQQNSLPSLSVVSRHDEKDYGHSPIDEQVKFEIFPSSSFINRDHTSSTSSKETRLSSYEDGSSLQLRTTLTNEDGVQILNSSGKFNDLRSQKQISFDSASVFNRSGLPPASSSSSFPTISGRARPSFHEFLDASRPSTSGSLSSFSQQEKDSVVNGSHRRFSTPEGRQLPSQKPGDVYIKGEALIDSRIPDDISEPSSNKHSLSSDSSGIKDIADGGGATPPGFMSSTKNEDFAVLEQHIEDLTQEKFSLQRALESSRSLAETLASENASLTENYNQQRKMINELKSEMDRMQEEIRAHLVAVEAAKMESANALLECSAADERGKILAAEVIGLEEKALRLRSNELKLEKQMESLNAEIGSYKRKLSSLEKERNDFQYTIEALQEEKKLLQSKVRKISLNDRIESPSVCIPKTDAFTSTEDLVVERDGDVSTESVSMGDVGSSPAREMHDSFYQNVSSLQILTESRRPFLPDVPSAIPLEQQRMVSNINSLISELALEKEELLQALRAKSADYSKLMNSNKELTQKLERQTQRLEFLAAQQMVGERVLTRPVEPQNLQETTGYTDEGDEVVERVLGWIMKLFPGGSSKRRTSKLL